MFLWVWGVGVWRSRGAEAQRRKRTPQHPSTPSLSPTKESLPKESLANNQQIGAINELPLVLDLMGQSG
ncbi:hypothetical protein AM228_11805 [Planktothricoides sp. SR001]|nr:hypothetical protein AM228_11805 [Planktothricoides sp. SR001]